jgi:magnesium-transporting ATPase (P-type)
LQSILTGESHSVEKQVAAVLDRKAVYQDKVNIMFSVSSTAVASAGLLSQLVQQTHTGCGRSAPQRNFLRAGMVQSCLHLQHV